MFLFRQPLNSPYYAHEANAVLISNAITGVTSVTLKHAVYVAKANFLLQNISAETQISFLTR